MFCSFVGDNGFRNVPRLCRSGMIFVETYVKMFLPVTCDVCSVC